ncbi:transporter substrate-binding domain-containing protein [Geoglobus sp.]
MRVSAITILAVAVILITPVTAIKVRVGVYNNPPLLFYENGQAKGLFIDILEYTAKKEGWEIEYIHASFPTLLEMIENGEVDVIPDIAYSEEREEFLSFSNETVISNWGVICSKSDLDSILDLKGMRVAGVVKDIYYENLKLLTKAFGIDCKFIDVYGDYGDVLNAVKSGKADAGVVSRLYGKLHGKEYGTKVTSIIFSPVELRFAAAKGKEALLQRIDYHLSELKREEGSLYYASLDKWVGTEKKEIPKWVFIVLFILIAITSLAIYNEYYLKKELSKREKELIRAYNLLKRISRINEIMLREKNLEKLVKSAAEVLGDYLNSMIAVFSGNDVIAYGGVSGHVKTMGDLSKYHCVELSLKSGTPRHFPPEKHPPSCPHAKNGGKFHSYVFPLRYAGVTKGVLFIQSKTKLTGKEIKILRTLAEDIAFAVHSIEVEEEKNEVLRQLDENVNDMMALVDRIRNPLSVIKGYSELFCESAHETIDQQIGRILEIVRKIEERWKESEALKDKLKKY